MLIKNTEALKSWLIIVLEPLCDADSSALARYVLALLKKDKPQKELKQVMYEQLDVFLSEATKVFVDRLFAAINSECYINPPDEKELLISTANLSTAAEDIDSLLLQTSVAATASPIPAEDAPTSSAYADKNQTPVIEVNKTKETHNKVSDNTTERFSSAEDATARRAVEPSSSTASSSVAHQSNGHQSHVRSASPPARTIADKENQPREGRRRHGSLRPRSRTRTRSRSNERAARRSRSRDRRVNDREKNQRQFRNKSPPTYIRYQGPHDRRRGSGGGGGGERRRIVGGNFGCGAGEDRSPRFVGGGVGGETGRKVERANRSHSRSRSPSVERVSGSGRSKVSPSGIRTTRTSPDRHNERQQREDHEKRKRCRDFDEKGYCVRGETCPWDHGINPVVFEGLQNSSILGMNAMREYNPDNPDLWVRGVGPSGVGTGAPHNPGGPAGIPGGANINPFSGTPRSGNMLVSGPGPVPFPQMAASLDKMPPSEYGRANAAVPPPGFRGVAPPMLPFPFNAGGLGTQLQRELIPIPVVDAASAPAVEGGPPHNKRRYELDDANGPGAEGPVKRKVPLNSRLGPRLPNMQNNCSLELRKVPRGLNSIAHLNNHFSKFGKIVNIQITYDGDPEAAIVTFSTHAEANVAYRSTEAVLNNRFIKVFWHSQDLNTPGNCENGSAPPHIAGRKNSQYHLTNLPATPTPAAIAATEAAKAVAGRTTPPPPGTTAAVNVSGNGTVAADGASSGTTAGSVPANATQAIQPSMRPKTAVQRAVANASIRKKQEEQAKAVVQLANGLRKRKHELLQGYLKQLKSALELVERCEANDPQRANMLETIKVLHATIDKLRKEIATEQEQLQTQINNQQLQQAQNPKKTKEQQKKELLDIELELFAQQQEGNDTSAIQKRIEELQRSLGVAPNGGAAAGATNVNSSVLKSIHFPIGSRPMPRSTRPEGSTRVDRRPKTIVVTGFTSEEADFVLGHFKHFGEITKHDVDKEIPQLILSYATRINAEQAILRGKLFKDKRLHISWAPVVSATPTAAVNTPLIEDKIALAKVLKSSATPSDDTIPELRLEDEEEEDESEDRSWRR